MGGKLGSSLQSSMSGQMNPTNMARNAYGSTSPTSGFSQQSANMPMAYGPGGTQTQRNPYMYQLYGSSQNNQPMQMSTPGGGYSNFGSMGPMQQPQMQQQPFDREGAYQALMNSSLGQKLGFALDPSRGIMNPSLGMQSYGVGPYAEGATDYQGMAQTASGVGENAGSAPAPAPKREMPSWLVPYSQAGIGNTPSRNQPLHGRLGVGGSAFMGTRAYNTQTGAAPNVVVDDKYRSTNELTGELNPFIAPQGKMAQLQFGGGNPYNEEFLYDPTTNTLYSPGAAQQRFGY